MQLTGIITCYNSADYLDYVIRSALQWVDSLVIVEGAFQIAVDAGCPHRSIDGTSDILDKYDPSSFTHHPPNIDIQHVLVHRTEVPAKEHRHQYDIAFQLAKQRYNTDWIIMIDSDEIYPRETQRVVKKLLSMSPNHMMGYRMYSYNFINDFHHCYDGCYPRIFRPTPQSKFVYDNEVAWPDLGLDGDKMQWPTPKHIGIMPKNWRFFHYAYVKSHEYLNKKAQWMYNKDGNPDYDPANPKYRAEDGKYKIPDSIEIKKFGGKHPRIMKNHPIFEGHENVEFF